MFTCTGRDSITSSDSQRICHLNKSLLQSEQSLLKGEKIQNQGAKIQNQEPSTFRKYSNWICKYSLVTRKNILQNNVLFQLTPWALVIEIKVKGNVLKHTWHTDPSAYGGPFGLSRNRKHRAHEVRTWSSRMKASRRINSWTCQVKLTMGETSSRMWRT